MHEAQQEQDDDATQDSHPPQQQQQQQACISPGCEIVQAVADKMRQRVREYTENQQYNQQQQQPPPKLVGILGKDDLPAETFSQAIHEACLQDGIHYTLLRLHNNTTTSTEEEVEAKVIQLIQAYNHDPTLSGLLIYYPLLKYQGTRGPYKHKNWGVYYKTKDDYLRDLVHARIDVEGLSCLTAQHRDSSPCRYHKHGGMLHRDRGYVDIPELDHHTTQHGNLKMKEYNTSRPIFPCTALSVVRILQHFSNNNNNNTLPVLYRPTNPPGQRFSSLTITIINRSEVLGRPLSVMLANDGATVYSVDEASILRFRGGRVHRCDNHCRSVTEEEPGTLEECVKRSNVVVTGVPEESFCLPTEWFLPPSSSHNTHEKNKKYHHPPTQVVVNVAHVPNVVEAELHELFPQLVYIPLVGKMTVACLEHNLIALHHRQLQLLQPR